MKFVVKNTTTWSLADLLCPHTCRGCGHLGAVLCECCKNDILRQQKAVCPLCKTEIARKPENVLTWKCADCELPGRAIFVGGWREGALAKVIKDYKYEAVRAARRSLVEILDAAIPENKYWSQKTMVIVPLPTIGRHVRERGIDHTLKLGKLLAKRRGWQLERMLVRKKDTVQVGTKAARRQEQAKEAYEVALAVDENKVYVLLDDIWTTGASMIEAMKAMEKAGAKEIYGAVLATGR